jgi:hypothetical protein
MIEKILYNEKILKYEGIRTEQWDRNSDVVTSEGVLSKLLPQSFI